MCYYSDSAVCEMNDSGAKFIRNMKWPNLKLLDIGTSNTNPGTNGITVVGLKWLLSEEFPKL